MRAAIITVAGKSSRFNKGIPEAEKQLKAIYGGNDNTLLYHLLQKCAFADRIVVVGGYKFESLKDYCIGLESLIRNKISLVFVSAICEWNIFVSALLDINLCQSV